MTQPWPYVEPLVPPVRSSMRFATEAPPTSRPDEVCPQIGGPSLVKQFLESCSSLRMTNAALNSSSFVLLIFDHGRHQNRGILESDAQTSSNRAEVSAQKAWRALPRLRIHCILRNLTKKRNGSRGCIAKESGCQWLSVAVLQNRRV